MTNSFTKIGVPTSLAALVTFGLIMPISEADAQRRGGGGGRAGASMSRPSGGGMNRSSQVRSSASSNINYGGKNRASTANRGGSQFAGASTRPSTGSINSGGNRNNINTGGNRNNINTGNINTGDINIDRDVHVDNNCCGGWGDWDYHPVAAGVAVGTAAAVTRAWALGAYYSTLPTNCVVVVRGAVSYYQCGTYWYQPVYSGMTVQYVAVKAP